MLLTELFDSRRGNDLDRKYLTGTRAPKGVNYVSRTAQNNGVTSRVVVPQDISAHPAGALTVALGSRNYTLATFLQPEPFLTGQNVQVLRPLDPTMTINERLWWALCITANRYRFGYGRHANRTLDRLELPDAPPSWVLERQPPRRTSAGGPSVSALTSSLSIRSLENTRGAWAQFIMEDLFILLKGSRLTRAERTSGDTPFVAATMIKNGWVDRIAKAPDFPALSISVPYNGGVGYAFLQPVPYCASDDVHVLIARENVGIGALLFACSVIRNERYRFSYGRKWNMQRMRRSTLYLPATPTGEPDWLWMDRWISTRPFSKMALTLNSPHVGGSAERLARNQSEH